MADSLSYGLVSPSEVSSASCSSYCSLGTRWKESRTGCPAFLSKFIVIEVIQTFEKETDNSTLYRLSIYNDGTYAATRAANYRLSGGTSTSGSGYSSLTGAVLTVMEVKGIYDSISVTVSPVSYTFVNGGYDYISDVGSFCVANVMKPDSSGIGHTQNYTGSRASFIANESATGPASAFYYIANNTLELRVGSDQFRVRWNGSYL